ncbi:MAG TPA: hypothetical protein VI454_12400, partial [Verrucomicrobiae bacterium]
MGVHTTLELLGRLRQVVRDANARGSQIEQEYRLQLRRERIAFDSEAKKLDAALAAATAGAESAAQTEKQRVEARSAERGARIDRALKQTLGSRLGVIDEQEGRHKFKIQRDLVQATRTRETDRANAEQAFEQFRAVLAQDYQASEALSQRAVASFGSYKKLLQVAPGVHPPPAGLATDENKLLDEFRELIAHTADELRRFRWSPLPMLFRILPLPVLLALAVGGHVAYGAFVRYSQSAAVPYERLGGWLGAALVVVFVLYFIGRAQARPAGASIGAALEKARRLYSACSETAALRHQQTLEDIEKTFEDLSNELNQQWGLLQDNPARPRQSVRETIEETSARILAKHERLRRAHLDYVEQAGAAT